MLHIRPVSDLRNKFPEIETAVKDGQPVFLTKNGYGVMVVMSLEKYAELTDDIERKLDEADLAAADSDVRYTHEEVFSRLNDLPFVLSTNAKPPKKPRAEMFGCLRGEYKIADDFDAPLDDFKEYME